MRKEKRHWQKSMLVTVVLILLIIVGSFVATGWINHMEEEHSVEQLYDETRELSQKIEANVKTDREQLEMIATVIAGYEDMTSKKLWKILDSYTTAGMMSRLEILLPDDTVVMKGGQRVNVKGQLSFDEESAQGVHITERENDISEEETYILRHYVPVVRDGRTVAMLYGVVELENLPEELLTEIYGGEAAVYIIEGDSGNFLVDTWHDEPGNIWSLGERKMAPGYSPEQLKQGLTEGEAGYVVFVSETIGRNLYFYYEPMNINQWRIALSVSEDVVFASANVIRQILNWFLAFEAICFILYFFWMLRSVKRETSEKQRQLDAINYIYDVENLLFNAHEKQENISMALEKIACIISADKVCFWMPRQPDGEIPFIWQKNKTEPSAEEILKMKESLSRLLEYFEEENSQFEAYDAGTLRTILPEAKPGAVKSLMAVAVEDMNGMLCGILAAFNMPEKRSNLALLKSMGFSFSMFCHNMESYTAIKEQGEKDVLSGLYNRNRYEMDLPEYLNRYKKSLACIYVDVNGLHELNNSKGHEAGDRMLKTVAKQMREKFGTQYTYRIGGDEFLAFAVDKDRETVGRLCREMEAVLAKKNFHISVGVHWETEVSSMDILVKEAEKKMYMAKRDYYEKERKDDQRKVRR